MNINGANNPNMQVLRANQMLGPIIGIFISQDGKSWTRINEQPVQDDLETAIAKLRMEHSIHSPNSWLKIVDQKTGNVLHDEPPAVPHEGIKQYFPEVDVEEQTRKRAEWLEKVIEWIIPSPYMRFLSKVKDDTKRARLARKWLKRNKIEVQTHKNGAQRVMRDGESIAEWLV